jgi:hypothetical protein
MSSRPVSAVSPDGFYGPIPCFGCGRGAYCSLSTLAFVSAARERFDGSQHVGSAISVDAIGNDSIGEQGGVEHEAALGTRLEVRVCACRLRF